MLSLPSVPETFHWTTEPWGPALRCHPLDAIAPHLFTSRQLQLTSEDAYAEAARSLGTRDVVSLTQVHGSAVTIVRRRQSRPHGRPEGDALASDDSDVTLMVRAADCVPLLMADAATGVVAAVHAGWRGTAARIAVAALEALRREFGSEPADIVAAIGPSIGACCYEVGPELVDAFAAAGHERSLIDRWFVTRRPDTAGDLLPSRGRDRATLHLDVPGANRDQLILAGVPEAQIHLSGLCTAMHLEVLTSYRAEKEKAGRIAAVIRARP